jgi:carbamoyltransferase
MLDRTYYLGLCVTYHDPALAIVDQNGAVLFAEATERFLQCKRALDVEPDHLSYFPEVLEKYCELPAKFVVALNWRRRRPWYENAVAALGILRAEGLLRKGLRRLNLPLPNYKIHHMMACQRCAIHRAGLNVPRLLQERFPDCRWRFVDFDHHLTHAAIGCFGSPFDEAVCAVVDTYGERGGLAHYYYRDGQLHLLHESRGMGSLGMYYMKLTELCGFDWLKGEEWKVMGLAAYGRRHEEAYRWLRAAIDATGLDVRHDRTGLQNSLRHLEKIARKPGEPAEKAANLAFTGQEVFSEIMAELLGNLHALGLSPNLVLAGGCALNSSFNGSILDSTPFTRLYVPPAPADDGTALGAAWLAWRSENRNAPVPAEMLSPYLGASHAEFSLANLLRFARGLKILHRPGSIAEETAQLLAAGRIVGWFQGRAEFGPRALGNRSIVADPRDPGMKERINAYVKFREEYRPFAPSVLPQYGPVWFENYQASPYMERTLRFRPDYRKRVPAVVHVDGTGRVQSVEARWNPRFHRLIEQFHRLTGVPMVLNTSFNVMGKPIVHSVEDAVAVFLTTGLDALAIGDYLLLKPD